MTKNKVKVFVYCRTGRYESEDIQKKEKVFNELLNRIETNFKQKIKVEMLRQEIKIAVTNYRIKKKELSISR